MAYVPGFKNDLFISFSHNDNQLRWVEEFHRHLEVRLAELLGPHVAVWRDVKLRGNDVLSGEVFNQLKSSALLVSIVTPTSVTYSTWCREERQEFEKAAQLTGGLHVGNKMRAVNVVKTPLDNNEHRKLFDTLGFEFYERNEQTGHFREFDRSSKEFTDKLDDLAQHIKETLNEMCRRPPPRSQPAETAVYVAEVSSDLALHRQPIVQQLQDWGYPVRPDGKLQPDDRFRSAVQSALAGCILSVHLVSSQRGAIPENENKSIVALQYELAQSPQREQIVWILPGSSPDPSVLASLEQGLPEGIERLEGRTIETLKELIELKLKRLRGEIPLRKPVGKEINIYLICNRKDHPNAGESQDRERARKLTDYLEGKGFKVWLPPVSVTEEKERLRDHRQTLRLSQAVILYWGMADELWFRDNLRELTKAKTGRSSRRFLAEAIYFSRPPKDEKSQYRRHLDLVFEQFNGFDPETLHPLLKRLHQVDEVPRP